MFAEFSIETERTVDAMKVILLPRHKDKTDEEVKDLARKAFSIDILENTDDYKALYAFASLDEAQVDDWKRHAAIEPVLSKLSEETFQMVEIPNMLGLVIGLMKLITSNQAEGMQIQVMDPKDFVDGTKLKNMRKAGLFPRDVSDDVPDTMEFFDKNIKEIKAEVDKFLKNTKRDEILRIRGKPGIGKSVSTFFCFISRCGRAVWVHILQRASKEAASNPRVHLLVKDEDTIYSITNIPYSTKIDNIIKMRNCPVYFDGQIQDLEKFCMRKGMVIQVISETYHTMSTEREKQAGLAWHPVLNWKIENYEAALDTIDSLQEIFLDKCLVDSAPRGIRNFVNEDKYLNKAQQLFQDKPELRKELRDLADTLSQLDVNDDKKVKGCKDALKKELKNYDKLLKAIIMARFEIAGGCARFFFQKTENEIKEAFKNALGRISTEDVSTLFASYDRDPNKVMPVSLYVARLMAKDSTLEHLKMLVLVAKRAGYGSIAGGVFEVCLKEETSLCCTKNLPFKFDGTAKIPDESDVGMLLPKIASWMEYNSTWSFAQQVKRLTQSRPAWMWPLDAQNQGFDFLYVDVDAARLYAFQATVSSEHSARMSKFWYLAFEFDYICRYKQIQTLSRLLKEPVRADLWPKKFKPAEEMLEKFKGLAAVFYEELDHFNTYLTLKFNSKVTEKFKAALASGIGSIEGISELIGSVKDALKDDETPALTRCHKLVLEIGRSLASLHAVHVLLGEAGLGEKSLLHSRWYLNQFANIAHLIKVEVHTFNEATARVAVDKNQSGEGLHDVEKAGMEFRKKMSNLMRSWNNILGKRKTENPQRPKPTEVVREAMIKETTPPTVGKYYYVFVTLFGFYDQVSVVGKSYVHKCMTDMYTLNEEKCSIASLLAAPTAFKSMGSDKDVSQFNFAKAFGMHNQLGEPTETDRRYEDAEVGDSVTKDKRR